MKAKSNISVFERQISWILSVAMLFSVFLIGNIAEIKVDAATSNNWCWPTSVHSIKSDWPNYSSGSYHGGTDFPVALNSPVYSTCDGEVVDIKSLTTSYGKHIKIKAKVNGSVVYMRYCHLNSFCVSVGDKVSAGQLIAYSGSTGNSTGPHMHYEVRDSNDRYGNSSNPNLNPRNYLPGTSYNFETNGNSYADIGTGFYAYIINSVAWKMVTVNGNSLSLQKETAFRNQIWYFERQSDLSYKITSVSAKGCLEVANWGSTDGSTVQVVGSNDTTAQRWCFESKDGKYIMHPKYASNMALDISGGSTSDGAKVQLWTANGTAAQYFTIWKFDNKPSKPTVISSSKTYTVGSNVKVSWGENAFATSYWVDVWHNNQHTESFGINDTSYTVKNVTVGEYTVFVASCNPNGASETGAFTFNVPTYTISYNMNGGSGSIGNQTKNYNQDLTLSGTKPTRTGYDFVGWNTNASATTAQYSAGGKYTANSGATLYAIWKAKQVAVTFYRNQNGSDNTTATQTFTYGVNNQSFSNKNWSKDGHTLLGWSENRSATDKQYDAYSGVSWDWINSKSPNVNLYAVWKANTYTVSYNMNGGSGSIANQTKIYGQDLILSSTKPTRTGYEFLGWNTNASPTTAQYSAGGKYTANSGATLYAVWKEIGHVMTESEAAGRTIPDGDYYIVSEINRNYFVDIPGNDFNTTSGTNVQMWIWSWESSMPPKEGYDCFHFEYLNNGFYKITQINTKMCIDVANASMYKGTNVQMCVDNGNNAQQWSVEKTSHGYRIRSKCNAYYLDVIDGKHENGTNVRCWSGNDSKAQSFSFIPRNLNEQPIADGVYTVKTNVNKACYLDVSGIPGQFKSGANVQIYKFDNAAVAEKYTIKYAGNGWYKIFEKTSGLIVEFVDINTNFLNNSKNVQLANDNGGKNQLWKIRKNSDGTYFIINKANGYYLDLENSKTDNGSNVSQCTYNGSNAQRWIIELETYTISYNMNGGSGSIGNQTKNYNQDLTLSSTKPTRTGYDFVGWNTNASATTARYSAAGKYTDNSGATLYAIWKDSSKPTITNATITKVSNKGYRVNCNVGDNVGVTKVQIKVWTEKNGQDDVVLHNGSVSNGLVTAYIETSKHNNETGNYITEIYAYDNAGNSNVIKANNTFVSNEPQKIKTIDYNNHTYIVYVADKSWTDAKTWCEQNGGYLVTVTDESEWNKVKELLGGINGAPAWLGAESTSGSWKWVTGESLTFSNWIKGQPDNAGKKEFYLSTAYEGLNCYGWNDWENSASQVGAFVYERANTYTITYDMNGGSGSVENQTKTYGQDLTLSSTKPTRTGYEFIGWNTNASATSVQYQPNDKYTTNSGATLYAVWKKLAENTPQIIVENKTASAGSEVKVNVSLKNNPGVSSMGLTLKYDKTKLTLKAVNYNSAMGGQSMQPQTMDSPVILNWVSPVADYSGDGTYAELVFKVLDNAEGGTTPIEITYNSNNIYNLKDENIAFAVKNGTVTVRDYIPGDINNDGVVNNKDFSRLFQYLSGWNVVVNEVALDVNGDGSVNNKDATRLFQYVSGWNVNIY